MDKTEENKVGELPQYIRDFYDGAEKDFEKVSDKEYKIFHHPGWDHWFWLDEHQCWGAPDLYFDDTYINNPLSKC